MKLNLTNKDIKSWMTKIDFLSIILILATIVFARLLTTGKYAIDIYMITLYILAAVLIFLVIFGNHLQQKLETIDDLTREIENKKLEIELYRLKKNE